MIRMAIYGKGGIGKSTTASHVSAALAERGLTVLQIGCDPKADSTASLCGGVSPASILGLIRERQDQFGLEDMIRVGYGGVLCAETGGPSPGTGCAGRGIITALEKLKEKGVYDRYHPDAVIYDVLGDVVCGGFSMPMRKGYADRVFILTSGEHMAIHAAANIAMAVEHFRERGYASLGGLILNHRNVERERERVQELAEDFHTEIVGELSLSPCVPLSQEQGRTVLEAYPDSQAAGEYRALAGRLAAVCEGGTEC